MYLKDKYIAGHANFITNFAKKSVTPIVSAFQICHNKISSLIENLSIGKTLTSAIDSYTNFR